MDGRVVAHTDALALVEGVGLGNGGQQRPGVGVQGTPVQLLRGSHLHQTALVHHPDAVGEVLHHRQVVGDEQDGQIHLLLEAVEQVDHLGLDGHVQRADGLVGNDEGGVHHQRPGDAHPLALSAGKLMGIAGGVIPGQAHLVQDVVHPVKLLLFVGHAVDLQPLGNDLLDGHPGVQGGNGILEDHLHIPRQVPLVLLAHPAGNAPAVEVDLAAGGVVQADDGAARGGLAAAAFAHQAEGLPPVHLEGHVVHRLDHLLVHAGAGDKVILEVPHVQQRHIRLIRHGRPSLSCGQCAPAARRACPPLARARPAARWRQRACR